MPVIPDFLTALEPFPVGDDAPAIARAMEEAAEKVKVGPMAAVAGAFAEFVGRDLLKFSAEVIVENGGDIFLKTTKSRLVGVYAGEDSPLTGKIALKIEPADTPLGCLYFFGNGGAFVEFRQVRCRGCPFSFDGVGGCCRHCYRQYCQRRDRHSKGAGFCPQRDRFGRCRGDN